MKQTFALILGLLFVTACSSAPKAKRGIASIQEGSAELIYNALNVPEENAQKEGGPVLVGGSMITKSVGGLSCIKSTPVVPNAKSTYHCETQSHLNAKRIYKALNVEEKNPSDMGWPERPGTPAKIKSVGGLVCEYLLKGMGGGQAGYNCSISF